MILPVPFLDLEVLSFSFSLSMEVPCKVKLCLVRVPIYSTNTFGIDEATGAFTDGLFLSGFEKSRGDALCRLVGTALILGLKLFFLRVRAMMCRLSAPSQLLASKIVFARLPEEQH